MLYSHWFCWAQQWAEFYHHLLTTNSINIAEHSCSSLQLNMASEGFPFKKKNSQISVYLDTKASLKEKTDAAVSKQPCRTARVPGLLTTLQPLKHQGIKLQCFFAKCVLSYYSTFPLQNTNKGTQAIAMPPHSKGTILQSPHEKNICVFVRKKKNTTRPQRTSGSLGSSTTFQVSYFHIRNYHWTTFLLCASSPQLVIKSPTQDFESNNELGTICYQPSMSAVFHYIKLFWELSKFNWTQIFWQPQQAISPASTVTKYRTMLAYSQFWWILCHHLHIGWNKLIYLQQSLCKIQSFH